MSDKANILAALLSGGYEQEFYSVRQRERIRLAVLRVGRENGLLVHTRAKGETGTLTAWKEEDVGTNTG